MNLSNFKNHSLIKSGKPIFAANLFMKRNLIFMAMLGTGTSVLAQKSVSSKQLSGQLNTVTTMVPFLTISPDSRSASMGDAGVALFAPDANSIAWNMANLVNAEKKTGFSLSYAPWLRQLVDDVGFSYVSGYSKMGKNGAVGGAIRYFSLGQINFTDFEGNPQGNFTPNEFSIEGGYSTRFNEKFSMGVNLRFIYSNIAGNRVLNGISMKPGYSGAGDVSMMYKTKIKVSGKEDGFNFGVNIQNIGSKMTYTDKENRDFIPTNLKIGAGWNHEIDDYNKISVYLDANKLLVPTRPYYLQSNNGGDSVIGGVKQISAGLDPKVSTIQGMLQSFYDAPGGFKEEMSEWILAAGTEYWYQNQFAGRLGVFYESNTKGGRQYATLGMGFKYRTMALDAAYLVPFAKRHPLQNQMRFSLLFDIGALQDPK